MKKLIILFSIVFIFNFCKKEEEVDDVPDVPISWTKTFGGTDWDGGSSVQQSTDGGYIITGYAPSFGNEAVCLIKTDGNGDSLWTKTFGGGGSSVQKTADGGYIITGGTSSGNGDEDVYLIKTDGSGNELWSKTFGGADGESGSSLQQTTDGGYIIAGSTSSFGNGGSDVYLIKTDVNGDSLWTKTFGGAYYDVGSSVQQTSDGGYIICGCTNSFGNGLPDCYLYLIKTDVNGDLLWTKTFGGTDLDDDDKGNSIQQTTDGGYIITGWIYRGVFLDSYDVSLIKTDGSGNEQWTKTFGGTDNDSGNSVQQTTDGGYIICGNTESFGNGGSDIYLIKTDGSGNEQWFKTFGGVNGESGSSVQQTTDGGYIICGNTESFGNGTSDIYLIKTDENGNISQ